MHAAYAERKRAWTLDDVTALRELVAERIDPSVIAMKLKRAEEDVRAKAAEIRLPMRLPIDQRPA
ncbi:MAG: hypothetical protein ACRCTI_17335 [Beijerinckiaceae bacterium]